MLMMTHTWIMKEYLKHIGYHYVMADLYAYNVIPDLLPVHREITAEMTHAIDRSGGMPLVEQRESFIRFHVLLDDFSHFGAISEKSPGRFLNDSQGYTYIKGRPLIAPVMELHCSAGKEIEISQASYESHMLIEMAFDMVLCRETNNGDLLECLYSGLRSMLDGDRREVSLFLSQTFGIATATMSDAVELINRICTYQGLESILDDKGRMGLCLDKFGLEKDDPQSQGKMAAILNYGIDLVADYRDFLRPALNAIHQSGFSINL